MDERRDSIPEEPESNQQQQQQKQQPSVPLLPKVDEAKDQQNLSETNSNETVTIDAKPKAEKNENT